MKPLMEGAAVPTGVTDRVQLAQQLIFSRKTLLKVLEYGGWLDSEIASPESLTRTILHLESKLRHFIPFLYQDTAQTNKSKTKGSKTLSGIQVEKLMQDLRSRTNVSSAGDNLVKIEYRDKDPKRAQNIAQKFATLFVAESLQLKESESKTAFSFIDNQVKQYHDKLIKAENELKEWRSANLNAQPGTEKAILERIQDLRSRINTTRLELAEQKIKQRSLEKQLAGEAGTPLAGARMDQYRRIIGELKGELALLRLNYNDKYPEVVKLRHQIEDLTAIMEKNDRQRTTGAGEADGNQNEIPQNSLHFALRGELSKTKTNIATLQARLDGLTQAMEEEIERGRRVHQSEAVETELVRNYEVYRDIYHDLVKRRENARVSKNLDHEQQGPTLRIYESAFLPSKPQGPRFLHFVVGGLVVGFVTPMVVVYALLKVDTRIRSEELLSERLGLPVVAVTPHMSTPKETRMFWVNVTLLTLGFITILGAFLFVGVVRLRGVI